MSWEKFIRNTYDVREVNNPDEVRIHCPFCNDDKYHGYVSLTKEVFNCFRCHSSQSPGKRGYSAYYFLLRAHSLSRSEILDVLHGGGDAASGFIASTKKDKLSDVIERLSEATEEIIEEEFEPLDFPESHPVSPYSSSTVNRKAWMYIKKRLGKKAPYWTKELGFRYCVSGPYSRRILLPVYDEERRLIYFQGRAFMPPSSNPPYLNPAVERPLFSPLGVIGDDIVLCEGYFDALAIGSKAVAVFGSNLTDRQFKAIVTGDVSRITICFDDDDAGRAGMAATRHRLRPNVRDIRAVVDLGRDPGDIGPAVRNIIRDKSEPFTDELLVKMALK